MANYLGIPEYVPTLQPFQPNLGFYGQALGAKQQQFDQGMQKLSRLYGSALNSPLTADDNIARRDQFFKDINDDLKKIARLDLSKDENVQLAGKVFDPILNDKDIINDMVQTKRLHQSYSAAQQFKACIDPKKCGGEYWQEGEQALNYWQHDFKNATPDERLNMKAPDYVPFQNVEKLSFEAAKAAGFNISVDSSDGRWIATDTNGALLLGKDGTGILPQFLYGLFGKDPKIQQMYDTKAYVTRRNVTMAIARQMGIPENQAESVYMERALSGAKNLDRTKNDLINTRNSLSTNIAAAEVEMKKNPPVDGDPILSQYDRLQQMTEQTNDAVEYHDQVENTLKAASNQTDLRQMQRYIDGVVAQGLFQQDISKSAYAYAMGTAKHDLKVNPYGLAAFNNQLDFEKATRLKALDHMYWQDRESKLGFLEGGPNYIRNKNGAGNSDMILKKMQEKGLSWEDVAPYGIFQGNIGTPWAQKELVKRGVLSDADVQSGEAPIVVPPAEEKLDTYGRNAEIATKAAQQALSTSKDYLKGLFSSMQQEYQKADKNPDSDSSIAIKAKILADAKNILSGTGLNYQDLLTGETSIDNLDKVQEKKLYDAANIAGYFQMSDASSRVYNGRLDNKSIQQMQIANQTANGMVKQRIKYQKDAMDAVEAKYRADTAMEQKPEEHFLHRAAIMTMFDKDGTKMPYQQAKDKFTTMALGMNPSLNPGALPKMFDHFYTQYIPEYDKNLKSIESRPGSKDIGGAYAQAGSSSFAVDGNSPFTGEGIMAKKMFQNLLQTPSNYKIIPINETDINSTTSPGPENLAVAEQVMKMTASGRPTGLKMKVNMQNVPSTAGNDAMVFATVSVDDTPDLRKIVGPILGLKTTDAIPENQRTFKIGMFGNGISAANDFIVGSTPSPEDLLLRNDGQIITTSLPNVGSIAVMRDKGQLKYELAAKMFNAEKKKWEIVTQRRNASEGFVRDIFESARQDLNKFVEANNSVYQDFLAEQSTNAGAQPN